jgi:uncharacterized membrane protein YqaE (UPF0057 family)
MALSDRQQAYLMLFAFFLPPLATWTALGFPSDRVALGILASALITGVIAFVKEALGTASPPKVEVPVTVPK